MIGLWRPEKRQTRHTGNGGGEVLQLAGPTWEALSHRRETTVSRRQREDLTPLAGVTVYGLSCPFREEPGTEALVSRRIGTTRTVKHLVGSKADEASSQ